MRKVMIILFVRKFRFVKGYNLKDFSFMIIEKFVANKKKVV